METLKDYIRCKNSNAAIILMLSSKGSTPLTKGVSKQLIKQGVNVLPLTPKEGSVGYHSFPLESVEEVIKRGQFAESTYGTLRQVGTAWNDIKDQKQSVIINITTCKTGRDSGQECNS